MTNSTAALRKTIGSAEDLHAVVRTMKALAASSIVEYEQSVEVLADYYRTVELGLGLCIRAGGDNVLPAEPRSGVAAIVVFGSDQGLVGRFNEMVAAHVNTAFANAPGAQFWAVGERVRGPMQDAGLRVDVAFAVPLSLSAIVPLVGEILAQFEAGLSRGEFNQLHLVYNRQAARAVVTPVSERLLPLDEHWRQDLGRRPWPTRVLPEKIGAGTATLSGFVREYLFVSLFRACANSLASENASRLASMQRADRNIDTLLAELKGDFHRLRQNGIDEELFDVVAGYNALNSR